MTARSTPRQLRGGAFASGYRPRRASGPVGPLRQDHGAITPLDALEQLEAWREERAATRTTGFTEFDDVTGGFEPGQVWIVAGMPGQGRSTLASQWALLLAGDHGFDTHLVNKRDPTRKVAARLVASTAKVPASGIESPITASTATMLAGPAASAASPGSTSRPVPSTDAMYRAVPCTTPSVPCGRAAG